MEPLKQLNEAMAYIEKELTGEIDFQKVAQLACCSEYHFRRMFSFLSGMTLTEYIRYRRLTQAALELCRSNIKIINLAMEYGYDSPDAFTRAFHRFHGIPPKEARRNKAALKAVLPMTFQLTVKGGSDMDYRIIEKGAFNIIGLKKRIKLIYEGVNPEIQAMYDSLSEEDIQDLVMFSDMEPKGLLNASVNFDEGRAEGTELDHFIGVATTQDYMGKWDLYSVPASTWAVFTTVGPFPEALQTTWARIGAEWLPVSGYEITKGPELLWCDENEDFDSPHFQSEIWIPVIKKSKM